MLNTSAQDTLHRGSQRQASAEDIHAFKLELKRLLDKHIASDGSSKEMVVPSV